MRRLFLAGLVLVALAGCQSASHTVTGTVTLKDTNASGIAADSKGCYGTGGYSDIGPGASVILRDESGKILASTSLGTGQGGIHVCEFTFTLADVPDGAKFYVVTVSHRGEISKSHDDLAAAGWSFALTLGS